MKMHTDDQKYGFMYKWMLMLAHNPNIDEITWYDRGDRAWKLLQQMPEGSDDDQDELFKYSPKG